MKLQKNHVLLIFRKILRYYLYFNPSNNLLKT
jgi:hypothetical protein